MAQVGEGSDELFAGYNQYLLTVNFWKNWWKKLEKLPQPLKKLLFDLSKITKIRRTICTKNNCENWSSRRIFWGGAIAFGEEQMEFNVGGFRTDGRTFKF